MEYSKLLQNSSKVIDNWKEKARISSTVHLKLQLMAFSSCSQIAGAMILAEKLFGKDELKRLMPAAEDRISQMKTSDIQSLCDTAKEESLDESEVKQYEEALKKDFAAILVEPQV